MLLLLTIVVFTAMRGAGLSPTASVVVLAFGVVVSMFLAVSGLQLSDSGAIDAFSPVKVPPPAKKSPVKCPDGDHNLNLTTLSCPIHDKPDDDIPPRRAFFVDEKKDPKQEYPIPIIRENKDKIATYIGRDSEWLDINLPYPSISGHHAAVEYTPKAGFHLHAMDDAFGTFVNDVLVRDKHIRNNDKIKFGEAEFVFKVDAESRAIPEKKTKD
jgi:hypothetical protein